MYVPPWDPHEAMTAFLEVRDPPPPSYGNWTSCFNAVIRDARQATGRDLATGAVLDPESGQKNSWIGALAYLAMLDQVGDCFRPKGAEQEPEMTPSIVKALRYFTELPEDQIQAIYALRCCFAHDYSLVHRQKAGPKRPKRQYVFYLTDGNTGTLVQAPPSPWNGDLRSVRSFETVVDLVALGDMAEGVRRRLVELNADKRLDLVLADGVPELYARFAISIR